MHLVLRGDARRKIVWPVWEGISVACLLKNRVAKISNVGGMVFSHILWAQKDLVTPIGKNHMHAKAFCTRTVVYLF